MLRLLRSLLAGAAATLADLATLAILVTLVGLTPRLASLPALAVGGAVQFLGNRSYVFGAERGRLPRQIVLFVFVEAIALGLNAVFYDHVMRVSSPHLYVLVRLATESVVYLAWSYPMWHFVFRVERRA